MSKHEQEYKMIGLNIAYYRKLRGLSQLQLAELIDLSRTHISNIEAPNMLDIADTLNVPAKKLLDFHE